MEYLKSLKINLRWPGNITKYKLWRPVISPKNELGKSGNIIKSKLRWLGNITKIYLGDQGISPNISLCNQGISSEINTLILPSNSLKQISQKCSRFSLIAYLVEVLLNRQSTVLWVQTALFCTPSCSVIRIWRWVSDKKQELHTFREYLSSSPVFWWGPCCLSFYFFLCCPIMCLCVLSSMLWSLIVLPVKSVLKSECIYSPEGCNPSSSTYN